MSELRLYGYAGTILGVDLTKERIFEERLDEVTLRNYLGGTCLGIKYLYDKVRPGVHWDDPQNCISLASGPLGGTAIGGTGTFSVVTKGALTDGVASTQANGLLGAYLRFSGFDGMLIEGAASRWVYLYIHDGTAEFRDAKHLLDKDTWETEDAVKKELGYTDASMSVASIGPAGESLVKFAAIVADKAHIAGHNGVGAVMGSKRLKAIAVGRGKNPIPVKDRAKLSAVAKELLEIVKRHPRFKWGTLPGVRSLHVAGALPVKNYTATTWDIEPDKLAKFGEEYIRNNFPGKRTPCWACQFDHTRRITISEGKYAGQVIGEPDYEQFGAMGPVIGVTDVASVMRLAHEVDRLGMEVNEAGWVVGFVMECYEKGILTKQDTDGLEMNWGNTEATLELLNKIAHRQGIGNILAEGVMRAAGKIGGPAAAMAIYSMKGNTPRTHDHRAIWAELFDTCVSSLGTLEHDINMGLEQLAIPSGDKFSPDWVSTVEAKAKGAAIFQDSMGICRYNSNSDIPMQCRAVSAITGWDFSLEEALQAGRRAVNLARVFNIIHGIAPGLDAPSARYGSTPADGKAKGKDSSAVWQQMLGNYYSLMGWDKSGIPTEETLKDLGLANAAQDLKEYQSKRPK